MAVVSFPVGTTAPATYYGRCLQIVTDGDATNLSYIRSSSMASNPRPIFFARFNFIIQDFPLNDSGNITLMFFRDSSAATFASAAFRWTIANGFQFRSVVTNCGISTIYNSASLNNNYRVEIKYDITNERYETRLDGTAIHSINLTSTVTASRLYEVYVGNANTGASTYYIDNIRINDDTGDVNNSWPGTSYSEPIREIDFLSTQRCIGMGL